jgi:hypothetical protein
MNLKRLLTWSAFVYATNRNLRKAWCFQITRFIITRIIFLKYPTNPRAGLEFKLVLSQI